MTISTIDKNSFLLLDEQQTTVASLVYSNNTYQHATIKTASSFELKCIGTGSWSASAGNKRPVKLYSQIRVKNGGIISVRLTEKKKHYFFKKSTNWKLRFALVNKAGDELLTLLPQVNWQKEAHDYILQLNEEFEKECDSFLILQAVHCANCSLSMMTGGKVPALVSI